jgi:DNA-binding ferritin-like protein (Dps family)
MNIGEYRLPKSLSHLYSKLDEKILVQALQIALRRTIAQERKELKSTQARIRKFEHKYKKRFREFEKNIPPQGDYVVHEDYAEWSFLQDKAEILERDVADYEKVYGGL